MTAKCQRTIVIFGSSRPLVGSAEYQQAYELGKELVGAGYQIANGGYGGTMAGAGQGAKEAGAATTGVTCEAFGRKGSNSWIDKEIRTKDLSERLQTLIELGDGYVVLPGSTGTLLELAMVWELVNKQFLPPRPIICLTDYWKPVLDVVLGTGEADGAGIGIAGSCGQVVQMLEDAFAESSAVGGGEDEDCEACK